MPAAALSPAPAPPPVFEDLGLLIPEEMKSDAVWPAPDPALARSSARAAEAPLPLIQKPPAAPIAAEPAKSPAKVAALPAERAPANQPLPALQKDEAKARPAPAAARPLANEPAVIVAGPSETLPAAPAHDQAPSARDVTPKAQAKPTPITVRELPAAKAQLVDFKSNELVNESTLITGRRRTKHWVSMTNAVIGAICAACIASALTALVMQATEQARLRPNVPPIAVAAAPPATVTPREPAAAAPSAAETSANSAPPAALPAESATAASSAVTAEATPTVTPEPAVAVRVPNVAAAKRRPAPKVSTNPYDDYEPPKSESPKRAAPKAPADDDTRGMPSNPGF
jgi:hypothetical protein